MKSESFYRTGQAAKQLGVSSYHVRRLCEAGEIAAEISDGQQWRIPASEIARLQAEGVPPVPVREREPAEEPPAAEDRDVPAGLYANPSDQVIEAAEEVKIVESRLQKRRLERETEEVEDWFRDRQRRQAAEDAEERRQAEAARAVERRQTWLHTWTEHALESLPRGAPREVELEVHAAVQQALQGIQPSHPDAITRRLVEAAMQKALGPWRRKQEIERALQAGMSALAWDVQYGPAFAGLKQRAWEAAVSAVRKVRDEASYSEMAVAAVEAVQPMIREYEHQQACTRMLVWIWINGATSDETDAAKEAVQRALAALPIGAAQKQLERAKEAALAPFEAAVARRKEAERVAAAEQSKRRSVEWKADLYLDHIETYLQREYEFDGGWYEMRRNAERLRPIIREALIAELLENPEMTVEEIRESIADQIEDGL